MLDAVLYLQVAISLVVREIITVVVALVVPEGDPPDRIGAVLSTVIETTLEVARFPAESLATAINVWVPSATEVESQITP